MLIKRLFFLYNLAILCLASNINKLESGVQVSKWYDNCLRVSVRYLIIIKKLLTIILL